MEDILTCQKHKTELVGPICCPTCSDCWVEFLKTARPARDIFVPSILPKQEKDLSNVGWLRNEINKSKI